MNYERNVRSRTGFTRLELLALVAVLGLLVPFITAATRPTQARTAVCLSNLRALARAMSLYAEDNRGLFPGNYDDAQVGQNWVSGLVTDGPDLTNTAILLDPTKAKLTRYLPGVPAVYRCPASRSVRRIGGRLLPPARSYSLNGGVGTKQGGLTVDGAWLDGNHGHRLGQTWYTYGKYSDIVAPSPSGLFTFVDEDPNSLNDGIFGVSMSVQQWIDWPATHHDFGGAFAFADGHVERHRWREQTTRLVVSDVQIRPVPRSADNLWLQQRASAKIPK